MNPKSLRLCSCGVLCIGIASALLFIYKVAGEQVVFTGITAWVLAPYLIAFIPALLPQNGPGVGVILFGCVFLVGASAWVYYDVFFIHTGSYNGLYFFLVPAGQFAFCLVLLVWASIISIASAPRNTLPAAQQSR